VRPLALLLALLAAAPAAAQELFCDVRINRAQLQGNEYAFLDDLEVEVARYLNTRTWTDDVYDNRERIDCAFEVTLTEAPSLSSFAGEVVVRSSRPIYGTGQPTQVLLLRDDAWAFTYTRGQALLYDPNRFDPLTSLLDYYAHVILGYDYDTFAELGGTPHFEEARRIADLGRTRGTSVGWGGDLGEDRSRYALVQELLDPDFEPLRRAYFDYHYGVLDHFTVDPEAAWDRALGVLEQLHALYLEFNRRRYATDVFYAAKYEELTDLLVEAPARNQAYAFLSEMDQAHIGTYDDLVAAGQ
jgi:hypothetical protein